MALGSALLLLCTTARAAEPAAPEPPFSVETRESTFEFTSWSVPAAGQLPREDRTCRVGITWTPEGIRPTDRGCPEVVRADALATVGSWTVRPPLGVGGKHELGEVWFVYPYERPDEPRVLVRQAFDRQWSLPAAIDAAPYAIRAWSFLRYPPEAHGADRPDVTCAVHLQVDLRGYITNVRVEGCGDPFAEAARDAVAEWRFDPPQIDGGPVPSALSLSTTFVARGPDRLAADAPSERSHELWAERQFSSLTRDERIWFIKAALLGPELRDLGPGQVLVALPAPPILGDRPVPEFFGPAAGRGTPVRSLPDHPPVLVLGEPDHLAVEAYELPLPPISALPEGVDQAECPMLVQVDGQRRVFAWADHACHPDLRTEFLAAADQWLLRHEGPEDGNVRVRISATLKLDRAGASVTFPADALRTAPDQLPDWVHTRQEARPIHRVPPKPPRGIELPSGSCDLSVVVSERGRSRSVQVLSCPEGFEALAVRAIKRWQWSPATVDGLPIESTSPVSIRFKP